MSEQARQGPLNHALGKIILPSQTWTLREREEEFQRLIVELKRLALKKGYSQGRIASEVGVSPITVNHWLTGHSLTAQRKSKGRLKKFLAAQ
jgi:DNA-binding XRE family transcriptional regulator